MSGFLCVISAIFLCTGVILMALKKTKDKFHPSLSTMSTLGDRPAFPRPDTDQVGMSLRAYLAGQALAGILGDYGRVLDEDIAAEIAIEACWCADATLKELAKEGR